MKRVDKNGVRYAWRNRESLTVDELKECSQLFSHHYGSWSLDSPDKPGEPIRLGSNKLKGWMTPKGTSALLAYKDVDLIGHAFLYRQKVEPYGYVSWVTQLVVHKAWRKKEWLHIF